ncbi:hypothetical protein [Acetobacter phage phiAX1]|nr:hypothetical protein [Acetobacter phage phiAX1]
MTQNTEQNVRTREEIETELQRLFTHGVRGPNAAWQIVHRIFDEVRAYGAEEQRRKDGEIAGYLSPELASVLRRKFPGAAVTLSAHKTHTRYVPVYYGPANVAALEARIASLEEAEQLARADAKASKARVTVLEGALSAAVSALEQVTDGERGGYNARNGKFVSLQMSDGERADIIHSDVTTECEGALETARAALTREGGV